MTATRGAFLIVLLALGVYWLDHRTGIVEHYHLKWSWSRQLRHELGLAYGVLRYRLLRDSFSGGEQPWSRIGGPDGRILLGPLPLQDFGDGEALVKLGVTRVFSLVEQFEREAGWLYTPVVNYSSNNSEQHSDPPVVVHWYDIADHAPLPGPGMIVWWLTRLVQAVAEGRLCYVHCRAGIGRSASFVVAFLMHQENLSFDRAYASVQRWRPQVSLNEAQQQSLRVFDAWLDGLRFKIIII